MIVKAGKVICLLSSPEFAGVFDELVKILIGRMLYHKTKVVVSNHWMNTFADASIPITRIYMYVFLWNWKENNVCGIKQ